MIKQILAKVMRILINTLRAQERGTAPLLPIPELIYRAEARARMHWLDQGLDWYDGPPCNCGHFMEFRHSDCVGGGYGGLPRGTPIRDDQGWKCTRCKQTRHYGIPMNLQQIQEETRVRGGSTLMRPSKRPDERFNKAIMQRLAALGYIDSGVQ